MRYLSFLVRLINHNKTFLKNTLKARKLGVNETKNVNYLTVYDELHASYAPIFVLSTGRCGTKFLAAILQDDPRVAIYHTPQPELIFHSKFAYENLSKKTSEILSIIDAARFELLLKNFLTNKIYIETNNRITFFAYQLAELYPKAKFIHLIRNPSDFVRSGVSREWYTGKSRHDLGRIVPTTGITAGNWQKIGQVGKTTWLWDETNRFIEDFKASIDESRYFTIFAEDMFSGHKIMRNLGEFIGLGPNIFEKTFESQKKINQQKSFKIPEFSDWGQHDIDQYNELISDQARRRYSRYFKR